MSRYQYQVLRYVHDQFTGEFANIGLIVWGITEKKLLIRVTTKYSRLTEFFQIKNGAFLLNSLKNISNSVSKIRTEIYLERAAFSNITEITGRILIKDDSALQFAEPVSGVDRDALENVVAELYERIIDKYYTGYDTSRAIDSDAWRRIYKSKFDKFGLSNHLIKHVIKTANDSIKFDKAWKNGIWHCYQSLTFDLATSSSIKEKVYKWSGIIQELETAKEPMMLALLTISPKENEMGIGSFIKDKLEQSTNVVTVQVVEESEAENFVTRVQQDMLASNLPLQFPRNDDELPW